MSTAEPACFSTPEESGLRVETLSFARIPHQTRLFLDYLHDPTALREFYPEAVRFHHELPARAPAVLAAHQHHQGGQAAEPHAHRPQVQQVHGQREQAIAAVVGMRGQTPGQAQ